MQKIFIHFVLVLISFIFMSSLLFAANVITPRKLPSTVEPGVISNYLTNKITTPGNVSASTPVAAPNNQSSPLGPQAEKIKFKLTKITLEGNNVYSDAQLAPLYQDKINKIISVAELVSITEKITYYYRNNGYILTRAILPPQHVGNGAVHIRILEGFIDKVEILGGTKRTTPIIQKYLDHVLKSKPLQIRTLEYYLLLVNNIPGIHVKAVLQPSKTTVAASTLNVVADISTFNGYLSYDNYGTLYNGPNEGTIGAALNSIFRAGDVTRVTFLETARPQELKYGDLNYSTPIGASGLRFTADYNQSNTMPGLNLRPLKIEGKSNFYTGTFDYPLILSKTTTVSINGIFNYDDSGVNTFGQTLYNDHIRSIQAGTDIFYADSWKGIDNLSTDIEQGVNILGASHDPTSPTISRPYATSVFTKLFVQATRAQPLGATRFSFYMLAKGQYSTDPLLASEQFAFGGSQVGRGYDPADIIGDLGVGGTLELRMDITPGLRALQYLQPYVFYDGGIIWNRKNVFGSKTKQSETSTGFGIRFLLIKNVYGNLMLTQPLTKQDSTEAVVGNGRRPRGYFSITASI